MFLKLAVITLIIKILQHPVLQQLILTFTDKEFDLLRGYWLNHDTLLGLVKQDGDSRFSNLGERLVYALEQLARYLRTREGRGKGLNPKTLINGK